MACCSNYSKLRRLLYDVLLELLEATQGVGWLFFISIRLEKIGKDFFLNQWYGVGSADN